MNEPQIPDFILFTPGGQVVLIECKLSINGGNEKCAREQFDSFVKNFIPFVIKPDRVEQVICDQNNEEEKSCDGIYLLHKDVFSDLSKMREWVSKLGWEKVTASSENQHQDRH